MATHIDASPARSLIDELSDVTAESDEIPDAAPADGEAEAPPQTDPDAPAESVDGQADQLVEVEEPDAPEPEPAAPAEPVGFTPPSGGEPFAFRADGREVQVPGALKYEHGTYIPAASWATVQRHLADREAISAQLRQKDQQIASLAPDQHPDVIRARETLKAMSGLLDKGPAEVATWLDQFATNRPLLEAQIQNQVLQAQLQARQQQSTETEREQAQQWYAQHLPGYLQQNIDWAIQSDPALAELAGMGDQLRDAFWPLAPQLFVEVDRDYPEHNLRRGQLTVRHDVLKTLLTQRASQRAEVKKLEAAAKLNQAATRRAPATPTVPARGRPVPGARAKTYTSGDRSWKEDFLADALED